MGLSKGASFVSRLPWLVALVVAALLAVGAATPAAAARHIVAAPSLHRVSVPANGHHFDHSAKHHRAAHHLGRRFTPDPALLSTDAAMPCPSTIERVSVGAALSCAQAALLPPKTGPPRV